MNFRLECKLGGEIGKYKSLLTELMILKLKREPRIDLLVSMVYRLS